MPYKANALLPPHLLRVDRVGDRLKVDDAHLQGGVEDSGGHKAHVHRQSWQSTHHDAHLQRAYRAGTYRHTRLSRGWGGTYGA